ncbi:MAG: hypothetical protein P8I38_05965 [Arenicella sp.]|nr:hypothetical protein [Arenicella sp.]HAU68889.1 hypothetical protein [Gammaproteobacteria bacterium]
MQDKKKSADIINPGLGDIEKVREILFGKNVKQLEVRLSELEQHIESQAELLNTRIDEKFAALDQKLQSEGEQRSEVIKQMEVDVNELDKGLRHTLNEVEVETSDRIKSLQSTFNEAQEALATELRAVEKGLGEDKLSKQSLAVLLNELALKLNQGQ